MLAAAALSLSLIVNVAFEPTDLSLNGEAKAAARMSPQQKFTTLRPLIRSATDCIVRTVTADPRFGRVAGADINELIVASMGPCAEAMRSMIDAHDRMFGEGSGEAFFMGPYLDGLPLTIDKTVKGLAVPDKDTASH